METAFNKNYLTPANFLSNENLYSDRLYSCKIIVTKQISIYFRMSVECATPACFGCQKYLKENSSENLKENEIQELKTCTWCKIAKFCSNECLKQNWKSHHKDRCNYVKELLKDIDDMEKNNPGLENRHFIDKDGIKTLITERSIPFVSPRGPLDDFESKYTSR